MRPELVHRYKVCRGNDTDCYVTPLVRRRARRTVQGVAWPAGDRPVGETEDEKTGMQHVGHHHSPRGSRAGIDPRPSRE